MDESILPDSLDGVRDTYTALADPTRLRILSLLAHAGELCVCDLQRVLRAPQGRISRHLAILRRAGFVRPRRDRRWVHYSIARAVTRLHRAQIDLFRGHGKRIQRLRGDIRLLESLRRRGEIARCETQPLRHARTRPQKTNPQKAGARRGRSPAERTRKERRA